jgi:hypothetical protein
VLQEECDTTPLIHNLGTRWRCEVSFTLPPPHPPGKNPGIHCTEGWVGIRARIDGFRNDKKIFFPIRDSHPRPSSRNLPVSETHIFRKGITCRLTYQITLNPLNSELNPICYLLALLGAHHFIHVSRIRVKLLILRRLMSYIYGAPILDVSRSHKTTQHSR